VNQDTPAGNGPIVVVAAIDEDYVLPLTVMVRSLLENLRAGVSVRLFVLHDGACPASIDHAEASWTPYPIHTKWIRPGIGKIERLLEQGVSRAVPAVFYRLQMEDLLPGDVSKVIYMDADMLVLGDLAELWEINLDDHLALAVPDAYSMLFHVDRLSRVHLAEGISFDRRSTYFNSGMLVIDLVAWRDARIKEQALALAEAHLKDFEFYDQDVLNCVLQGRWKPVSPSWNLHVVPEIFFCWGDPSYARPDVQDALTQPNIVHFVSVTKPWHSGCLDAYTEVFHQYLKRTKWADEAGRSAPPEGVGVHAFPVRPLRRLNWSLWSAIIRRRYVRALASVLAVVASSPWLILVYPQWLLQRWRVFSAYGGGRWRFLLRLIRWPE